MMRVGTDVTGLTPTGSRFDCRMNIEQRRFAGTDAPEKGDLECPRFQTLKDERNRRAKFVTIFRRRRFRVGKVEDRFDVGEATHGTEDFYRERAEITKRLIKEKGFTAVAVEADFPDAFRVNRYVRGLGDDTDANEALSGFARFPTWMWRNTVMIDFVEWLREYNRAFPASAPKIGFYGLDLYSLYASIEAVLGYLDQIDPEAARRARYRYSCFEHYGEDSQAYGYAAAYEITKSCEDEVVNQLIELHRRAAEYANRDGFVARDEYFFAEQNARLIKNAEEYYRTMFRGRAKSWNLRDGGRASLALANPHLERTIGVIYLPQSERISHYFEAQLPRQFDAVMHFDETRALEPLELTQIWDAGEPPETYPFGV
jgi:erythromycin esterase-like protein